MVDLQQAIQMSQSLRNLLSTAEMLELQVEQLPDSVARKGFLKGVVNDLIQVAEAAIVEANTIKIATRAATAAAATGSAA